MRGCGQGMGSGEVGVRIGAQWVTMQAGRWPAGRVGICDRRLTPPPHSMLLVELPKIVHLSVFKFCW